MYFYYSGVNEAFRDLVFKLYLFDTDFSMAGFSERVPSRVGDVIQIMKPVIITYKNPRQRVLFNKSRDANPFFHLYESLWMLAGRNDVAPLTYYSSKYGSIVSDDGVTQNAAYGHRWRKHFGMDQVAKICSHLKADQNCRRQVLQMWDVFDLGKDTKDVACNTQAYFSIQTIKNPPNVKGMDKTVLNMTVCNRSNDLIWGALGANVVHFSFLQEYMAAHIGVKVGVYNQFTNNLHTYTSRWTPEIWLEDGTIDYYSTEVPYGKFKTVDIQVPLVQSPARFDEELPEFVERHSKSSMGGEYKEEFLRNTAQPMCIAFHRYKEHQHHDALNAIEAVHSDDWKIAGYNWLKKRADRAEDRNQYKDHTNA